MELGRIIAILHGEKLSVIRRTWMTKIFVTGDVLSFVVQGAGTYCPLKPALHRQIVYFAQWF